jgi:hypothetical protein
MTSQTVGLSWNRSTQALTRLENLAGLNLAQSTAYLNNVAPWSGMRRVNMLDSGLVSASYPCGYDDSIAGVAAQGQAMWMLGAYYYYTNHTPGTDNLYRWYISPTGASTDTVGGSAVTWKLHPAFTRGNMTKPWIAFGAYEAYNNSSKLESKAGVIPTYSTTLDNYRTYAQARGAGWGLVDYLAYAAWQLPLYIEYGSFYVYSLLGSGISNIAGGGAVGEGHRVGPCLTGHTGNGLSTVTNNQLGNTTGTVAFTTSAPDGLVSPDTGVAVTAISYRGLENPWGNLSCLIDGLNFHNYEVWIADHGTASANDNTFASPYVDTGLAISNVTAYRNPTDLISSATYDWMFLPLTIAQSDPQHYLCGQFYTATGNQFVHLGEGWTVAYTTPTSGNVVNYNQTGINMGARLLYVPQ